VSPQRRAKRTLAAGVPSAPGIYQFVADLPDAEGVVRRQVLYVGKSRNLRNRVRSYFTAAETRPRIDEMVRIATAVETTVCRTELEAEVLELRLIAAHSPRYNRRSKFPQRQHWLKITTDAFPRLSLVKAVSDDDATYFGPFSRRPAAEDAMAALHDAFPIRQCTKRLSVRTPGSACMLGELGKCVAPCELKIGRDVYGDLVDQVREALTADVRPVLAAVRPRLSLLVAQLRYEEARTLVGRLRGFLAAAIKHHRLASLAGCAQIVAARRVDRTIPGRPPAPAWQIHVIRHGRLANAAVAHPGEVPQRVARDAVATAETVLPGLGPSAPALVEETERIAAWLEQPGVRLIEIEGDWMWPAHIGLAEGQLSALALGARAAG
jgi:DNA polymerase-3 subunit epsilon